jgi:hypothetical protein
VDVPSRVNDGPAFDEQIAILIRFLVGVRS